MKHMTIAEGLMVMVACMASAVTGQAGVMTWNPETRLMAFSAGDGKPWLSAGSAQVVLTGGQVISTSDTRFKVTFTEHRDSWVLSGVDEQKTLDWEMRIASVDQRSVRMDWTVFNISTQPLKLDQLDILSGKLEGQVDPAKNRVMTERVAFVGWRQGGAPGTGKEARKSLHAGAAKPAAARPGSWPGRHNLDRFQLTQGAAGLEFTAYGECNQCVLPPGRTRVADPLFLSVGGHPLRQMEVFADLAARENGVQLWPENFATWCSWYAGWMRQESLYEFKSGLEKGVETNIPLVSKFLGTRGTPSMRVVDDSNEMPYGDWDNRTLAVAERFSASGRADQRDRDQGGCVVSALLGFHESRLFQERPELLCRNDDGQVAVGNDARYQSRCMATIWRFSIRPIRQRRHRWKARRATGVSAASGMS